MYFELPKLIKKTQNVIRAYKQCLESYLEETNVTSPIIEKPVVWSPYNNQFLFQITTTISLTAGWPVLVLLVQFPVHQHQTRRRRRLVSGSI